LNPPNKWIEPVCHPNETEVQRTSALENMAYLAAIRALESTVKTNFQMAVVLAAVVVACTDQSVTPEDVALNDRGVAHMGRYEYADAHAAFTEVVERAPGWRV
jgi:hypothetical protein